MLALSCDLSVVSLYWHLPLLSHGIMVKCQSNAHSSIISQQYRPSRYFLPNVFRICIRTCTLLASCFLHIIYSSKKVGIFECRVNSMHTMTYHLYEQTICLYFSLIFRPKAGTLFHNTPQCTYFPFSFLLFIFNKFFNLTIVGC